MPSGARLQEFRCSRLNCRNVSMVLDWFAKQSVCSDRHWEEIPRDESCRAQNESTKSKTRTDLQGARESQLSARRRDGEASAAAWHGIRERGSSKWKEKLYGGTWDCRETAASRSGRRVHWMINAAKDQRTKVKMDLKGRKMYQESRGNVVRDSREA